VPPRPALFICPAPAGKTAAALWQKAAGKYSPRSAGRLPRLLPSPAASALAEQPAPQKYCSQNCAARAILFLPPQHRLRAPSPQQPGRRSLAASRGAALNQRRPFAGGRKIKRRVIAARRGIASHLGEQPQAFPAPLRSALARRRSPAAAFSCSRPCSTITGTAPAHRRPRRRRKAKRPSAARRCSSFCRLKNCQILN